MNTGATYEAQDANWLTDESGETSERAATDSPWLFGSGSRSLATKCMTVVLPSGSCNAATMQTTLQIANALDITNITNVPERQYYHKFGIAHLR